MDAGGNGVAREELTELGHRLESDDEHLIQLSSRLNFLSERLHALVLRGRLRPFSEGVQGFPRLVRDLARDLGKSVEFSILGGATLIDRDILSRLDAPLNHLLRNALDHGIESPEQRERVGKAPVGKLTLEARHLNGRLLITLTDDGNGIDCERLREKIIQRGLVNPEMSGRLTEQELFAFLFLPGITTRETVSQISGRGVGLDVVQTMIHGCGGSIRVSSEPHVGTRFECQLPVTRSVVRCLRIEVDGHAYAFPLSRIHRAERIATSRVESMESMRFFRSDDGPVALFSARALMGLEKIEDPSRDLALVLFELEGRRYALEVDRLVGEMDLVVRPLDPRLGKVAHFSTVSIDHEGRPILIADVDDLIRTFDRLAGREEGRSLPQQPARGADHQRILVVDDSLTVREVERKLLQDAGYEVETAVDGVDGWNQLAKGRFALIVTDVDMPRMNGIELVTRIRADERFCDLPVVIVSYKDREEDRQLGLQAGADDYLTKGSVHDEGLLEAVRHLIGSREDA
jgi:two-component system sensor histidine kinase and response regulator WspE